MINFELKKLYKQKKLWIITVISFGLVLYSFIISNGLGTNRDYTNLESKYLSYTTKFLDYSQSNLDINTEKNKDFLKDQLLLRDTLKKISDLISGNNTGWYKSNYNRYIEDYKKIIDDQVYLRDKYKLNSREYDLTQNSEIDDNSITWFYKEFKYINENNVKSTTHGEELSKNFGKALIYNFSLIFGLPALILFIFIFSSCIAQEYEDKNNIFLYTQPIAKIKIILSKMLSNFIYVIFYFIISLIFMYLIYCIYGHYELNGFNEIYRVFNKNDIFMTNTFIELFPKLIFAFFCLSLLIITLTILIGLIFKNQIKTIGIITGLIFITNFLINQFPFLNTVYNPIYLFDYLMVLKGNISFAIIGTQKNINYIYNNSIFVYFIPVIYAGFILALSSIFINMEQAGKYFNTKKKFRNITPTKFECIKILENKNFNTLFILSISILSFLFIGLVNLNNQKRLMDNSNIHIEKSKSIMKQQENLIKNLENTRNKALENGESNLREYDVKIDFYKKSLENMIIYHNITLDKKEGFETKDTKKYYENLLKDTDGLFGKDNSNWTSTIYSYLKNEIHSEMSYKETTSLYKYAIENNIEVFKSSEVLTSEFDDFVSQQIKTIVKKDQFPLSNSGFQTLQYFNDTDNISYIILILSIFITIGGYTYDKEEGNQLELMYTQPVKRIKYFLNKLLSISLISIFIVLVCYLILFIFGTLTQGIGSYNYPIIKYLQYIRISTRNYFEIIPLWKYLLSIFILFVFEIVFLSNYTILISNFVKRKSTLIFITMFTIIIFNYVFSIIDNGNLSIFSPFSYLNPAEIANGKFIIFNKLSQFNQLYPYCILGISSIILFNVNLIISKYKR